MRNTSRDQFRTAIQRSLRIFAFGLIDWNGLASFLLLILILLAVALWLLYKFALLIFPALGAALTFLSALFLPYHLASRAIAITTSRNRLSRLLSELRSLEASHAPREDIWAIESRARDSAQTLANSLHESRERLDSDDRERQAGITAELADLKNRFAVSPEPRKWDRFLRLHLENEAVRAMVANPKLGLLVGFLTVASTTVVMAALGRKLFGDGQ